MLGHTFSKHIQDSQIIWSKKMRNVVGWGIPFVENKNKITKFQSLKLSKFQLFKVSKVPFHVSHIQDLQEAILRIFRMVRSLSFSNNSKFDFRKWDFQKPHVSKIIGKSQGNHRNNYHNNYCHCWQFYGEIRFK